MGNSGGRLSRAGRWSARHPWWLIAIWLVILIGATIGHKQLGRTYSDDFSLPNSPAATGAALLQAHNPGSGGQGGQIVFSVSSGTLAQDRPAIENAVAQVEKLPDVLSASDPLSTVTTSADDQTAYSTVHFSVNPASLGSSYITQVNTATAGARSAGVSVSYGGQLGQADQPKSSDLRSEVIGIVVAILVLLLGLYASGLSFIGALGLAAAIAVAAAALCAVTLVPALLGLAGRNIDRFRVRRPVAESGPAGQRAGGDFWHRYARRIERRPWWALGGGIAVLLVLAAPVLSLQLGHVDAGAGPDSSMSTQAYDAISSGFGPGANGPLTIAVQLDKAKTSTPAQVSALQAALQAALAKVPDVASAGSVRASTDGAVLSATVIPASSPQDAATRTLVSTLQDATLPAVLGPDGATGYVTGSLAGQLDFVDDVSQRLPLIIGVVIAAAFLLLLASFRSPVLALKAAVLNLFSIGAAVGVIVAVFQWGWGSSLFGIGENVPIESYVPMIMFAIVFGLSMDYEVFLLTRIREVWARTHDNAVSVAEGLSATARVISCAALIITCVFLAFLLSTSVTVKMLALGLGVSIIVDATLIRLVVVPATMFLLGRANWWTPRWLNRLPNLLEPVDSPAVASPAAALDSPDERSPGTVTRSAS